MVKLRKNKKSDANSKDASPDVQGGSRGISGRGNALRDAVTLGVLVVLIPTLASLAYLYLLRAPAQQSALLEHVSKSYAEQQAHAISALIEQMRQRLQASANAPQALEVLADTSGAAAGMAETNLAHYFPEAVGIRLIPLGEMGTADLDDGLQGLRNHIEVDLVRRVSNDELAEPEAYQYEGVWLASLAQAAAHPQLPDSKAVVLITIGADTLQSLLRYPGDMPGKFELQQEVFSSNGSRSQNIANRGSAAATAKAEVAKVDKTPWRIVFTPSDTLIANVVGNVRPDYDIVGLVFFASLIGFVLTLMRSSKALSKQTGKILSGATQTTALEVHFPQLLPLAEGMRSLAQGRTSKTTSGEVKGLPSSKAMAVASPSALAASETSTEPPEAISVSLPTNIFRAYDIRGIADSELNDDTVDRIGSAIGTIADEMGEQTLIIGCDGRSSSQRIKKALEQSLRNTGRDIIDIGLVPTPLLYFATTQLDAKSGIMITGSHNPPDHNGMKIVLKGKTVAAGTIDKIRKLAEKGGFSTGKGQRSEQDVTGDYMDEVIGDIAIAVPLKIVVDAGNGATSTIAPELLAELGCDVIPLHCEIDGSFPNRSPDTSDEDNLSDLIQEVLANDADFGVAFDGDGDRVVVVTGSGHIVRTDKLMMVFARDVVSRNPGADVVYDVKCSRNLASVITGLGGRPVLWKTGHAHMKEKMLETGALLGGEFSGHIFFGERWYGFDDGMYATGRLAEILSSVDVKLDELIADLPRDIGTPEILVPVPDEEKFALIERFVSEARFPDGKSNQLDGLRVDFPDGWGLLRASNTGPALTARFEAKDEATLDAIQTQFRKQLEAVAPDLHITF